MVQYAIHQNDVVRAAWDRGRICKVSYVKASEGAVVPCRVLDIASIPINTRIVHPGHEFEDVTGATTQVDETIPGFWSHVFFDERRPHDRVLANDGREQIINGSLSEDRTQRHP